MAIDVTGAAFPGGWGETLMVGLCAVGMVVPAWREGRRVLWVLCGFSLCALPAVSSAQCLFCYRFSSDDGAVVFEAHAPQPQVVSEV